MEPNPLTVSLKKRPKGTVLGCGSNEMWELGLGENHENQYLPTIVGDLVKKKVVHVAANGRFSACITAAGEVYAWGRGSEGQLGCGDISTGYFPKRAGGILKKKKAVMLALGQKTAFAVLDKNAGIVSWGNGNMGQLGNGSVNETSYLPVLIPIFVKRKVVSLSCGVNHCSAVVVCQDGSNDTEVYAWGDGSNGKLGNLNDDAQPSPVLVEDLNGCKTKSVHCGSEFTAVLTSRGDVYTYGKNDSGTLGHGHQVTVRKPLAIELLNPLDVVDISVGSDHMAAVTEDGQLYTWGYGSNGRLGHGDEKDQHRPVLVQYFADNSILIKRVYCGGHHTWAIAENGDVYAFGWTHYGQLGIGDIAHGDQGSVLPRLVEALQGQRLLGLALAEQHTIMLTMPVV